MLDVFKEKKKENEMRYNLLGNQCHLPLIELRHIWLNCGRLTLFSFPFALFLGNQTGDNCMIAENGERQKKHL